MKHPESMSEYLNLLQSLNGSSASLSQEEKNRMIGKVIVSLSLAARYPESDDDQRLQKEYHRLLEQSENCVGSSDEAGKLYKHATLVYQAAVNIDYRFRWEGLSRLGF